MTFSVQAQQFTVDGSKTGGVLQVAEHGNVAPESISPTVVDICGFDAGGFSVVWHWGDIFGQRYSAGGAKIGAQFRVNQSTADVQSAPAVATLPGTGFAVLWRSLNQDGDAGDIFGRKFD